MKLFSTLERIDTTIAVGLVRSLLNSACHGVKEHKTLLLSESAHVFSKLDGVAWREGQKKAEPKDFSARKSVMVVSVGEE